MNQWQDWIGRTSSSEAYLDPAQANAMLVTLDREPSLCAGDILPPAWHWLYVHEHVRASELGPDGHPQLGVVMPPVPLPRRMWAGGQFVFHAPLLLGTTVMRESTIQSITHKQGRSGPLFFVTVGHRLYTNDQLNLIEQQSIVYRELSVDTAASSAQLAPDDADYTQRYQLNSTALFRYSALTFNGHRIHYDADYARQVEGYPDLVIHGPLIATLLLDLYIRQGSPLSSFRYRAKSPLFLPHAFTVNGKSTERGARLWASNHLGELAMEAEAN